jgi:hypothetical protein
MRTGHPGAKRVYLQFYTLRFPLGFTTRSPDHHLEAPYIQAIHRISRSTVSINDYGDPELPLIIPAGGSANNKL